MSASPARPRLARCALSLSLLALPAAARGQSRPAAEADAQAAFDGAIAAWRRGDCAAAAGGFERAMALAAHPDTRYNLARALECANEVARAIVEYERFLAESGDSADRAEVSARLTGLRQRPVEIYLTTAPLDATVRVDADSVVPLRSPCHLRLAPGSHLVAIEREGFRPEVRRIVVEPGVAQDVHVVLPALPAPALPPAAPALDPVASRRGGRPIAPRVALLAGFSVPRDRPELAVGIEAGLLLRRSLTAQAHAIWITAANAPVLLGADLGWTFALSEVDLGLFVSGSALFRCDVSCREDTFRRDEQQFVGGFAVRADVLLHPRLGLGLFGRAAWRNFELTNSEALLATGGVAVSLHL